MHPLERYVGKDVWVKVHNTYMNDDYYIRILDSEYSNIGDSCITFRVNIIPTYCVLENGDSDRLSRWSVGNNAKRYRNYLDDTWKFHGDFLEVLTPVDVLTTDELSEFAYFYEDDNE